MDKYRQLDAKYKKLIRPQRVKFDTVAYHRGTTFFQNYYAFHRNNSIAYLQHCPFENKIEYRRVKDKYYFTGFDKIRIAHSKYD